MKATSPADAVGIQSNIAVCCTDSCYCGRNHAVNCSTTKVLSPEPDFIFFSGNELVDALNQPLMVLPRRCPVLVAGLELFL